LIIPDLPPEEAGDLIGVAAQHRMSLVFLIAPTTPDARIQMIDALSTDFSYCVSVTGVTGARPGSGANGDLEAFLQRVRRSARKRFVVGFGISTAEQVAAVWRYADGAVVGSALVKAMGTAMSVGDAAKLAAEFFATLKPKESLHA
jgi:tryptophan synthase alpha chain